MARRVCFFPFRAQARSYPQDSTDFPQAFPQLYSQLYSFKGKVLVFEKALFHSSYYYCI